MAEYTLYSAEKTVLSAVGSARRMYACTFAKIAVSAFGAAMSDKGEKEEESGEAKDNCSLPGKMVS